MSQQDKIQKELLALFLLILSYKNSYYYKALMNKYKMDRNILKDNVNRIYAKYSKYGEFKISYNDLNKELNKIDKDLKNIAKDLYYSENIALIYLLKNAYHDSYYKSADVLSKYIDVKSLRKLSDKVINDSINSKRNGLNINDRNKSNKEKWINKLKDDIKTDLQFGKTIDVINNEIDKRFNESATVSDTLISNEIARVFNESVIESYKDNGVTKVEYIAVLDERTTEICRNNSEIRIFNIDNVPIPPLHVNCRSMLVPYIE